MIICLSVSSVDYSCINESLTIRFNLFCCLSSIFIKVFNLLMATIRANSRVHLRKWWRACTRMVAINNMNYCYKIMKNKGLLQALYLRFY